MPMTPDGRFSLDECLDGYYLAVLWSSDQEMQRKILREAGIDESEVYSLPDFRCDHCIVMVVAKFKHPDDDSKPGEPRYFDSHDFREAKLDHSTKIFIVGIDRNSREICFVSDSPRGKWRNIEDYLIEIRDNPKFIQDLISHQCETSSRTRNPYEELARERLYGQGGIFAKAIYRNSRFK